MSAAICVPVRDEEAALPALLAALAAQCAERLDLAACFYLDGCGDGSAAVLARAKASFPYPLRVDEATRHPLPNAGRARRAAMALGLAGEPALLLSTDADSVPDAGWAMAAARALEVADVVAGTVLRREPHPLQTRIEAYYDRMHRYRRAVDPVAWDDGAGRHFSGGANLAIRSAAYRALGGFRALPTGEDAALLDDAARAGFRVRRDPAMIVTTSSRRQGRVAGGLASALAALDRAGVPDVAHPAAAAWQYRAQARARAAFPNLGNEAIAAQLGGFLDLSRDHLIGVARDCPNAEAFAMRIVPAAPSPSHPVPLAEAEEALAELERGLAEVAA